MADDVLSPAARGLEEGAPDWISSLRGALRSLLRSLGFALALAIAAAAYPFAVGWARGGVRMRRRAEWLHRWCRVFARVIGLRVQSTGDAPRSGMLVSNHLSYLDIVSLSAVAPCEFVAKMEVAGWPVFGWFAQMAGTIFVDRARRLKVADANATIENALAAGVVVVLFAEGTSSGGESVLPFRSSLLDAAVNSRAVVTPAAIGYAIDDGSVPEEVCYWGDMTLGPHLLNLLTKREIRARIAFGTGGTATISRSRKEVAGQLHCEVAALHRSLA